ncbi:MAG: imidazole glycerol phosphate synthase subunit HisH [Herpetosiphon sp.]
MIAVIDYGSGNLRSAVRALEHVGAPLRITDRPADLLAADAVVLPGVGATRDTMEALTRLEIAPMLPGLIAAGMPFLGICVGMQVLATESEEWGAHPCLAVVPGVVRRFPASVGKIPQIGWNQVHWVKATPLAEGIPEASDFYFVHSYYVDTSNGDIVAGSTDYGIRFPALFHHGNVAATQFHPEKSGRWGLHLLRNWVRLTGH